MEGNNTRIRHVSGLWIGSSNLINNRVLLLGWVLLINDCMCVCMNLLQKRRRIGNNKVLQNIKSMRFYWVLIFFIFFDELDNLMSIIYIGKSEYTINASMKWYSGDWDDGLSMVVFHSKRIIKEICTPFFFWVFCLIFNSLF